VSRVAKRSRLIGVGTVGLAMYIRSLSRPVVCPVFVVDAKWSRGSAVLAGDGVGGTECEGVFSASKIRAWAATILIEHYPGLTKHARSSRAIRPMKGVEGRVKKRDAKLITVIAAHCQSVNCH
jgi:hypothetical protein